MDTFRLDIYKGHLLSFEIHKKVMSYLEVPATIRRGVYKISELATQEYEQAREDIASFFNFAKDEVIFVHDIEYVSKKWGFNILRGPFHKIPINQIPINDRGEEIYIKDREICVKDNEIVDVSTIIHRSFKDRAFNMLFCYGPFLGMPGIGVMCIRKVILDNLPPFELGGDMVLRVEKHSARYDKAPYKFSAGTPDISGAIGLGEGVRTIQFNVDEMDSIAKECVNLLQSKKIEFEYFQASSMFKIGNETLYLPRQNSELLYERIENDFFR